ncbi:MAG: hypothetical protein WDO16_21885 [Bacteroidota bacterium]
MSLNTTINNIYSKYLAQSEKVRNLIKGFLIALLTYLIILIIFHIVRIIISDKSGELMSPYNQSNVSIGNNINDAQIPVLGNENYSKVFKLQREIIDLRRSHHYQVSMAFFKNYYSNTVCLMLISCIGGLLLFALVSKGWKDSSYTLKVLFLVMASAAVFISLFTNVFSQQKNFEENMLRYMDYTKTELKLSQQISELSKKDFPEKLKLPVTKDSIMIVDTLTYFRNLDTLVARNNATINNLTNYIFSIDAAKMKNMGEIYQALTDIQKIGKSDTAKSK